MPANEAADTRIYFVDSLKSPFHFGRQTQPQAIYFTHNFLFFYRWMSVSLELILNYVIFQANKFLSVQTDTVTHSAYFGKSDSSKKFFFYFIVLPHQYFW